jgi:hypothetical protein
MARDQQRIDYKRVVPEDSFLGRYLAHNAHSETATDYDWWCGMWLIANACGRGIIVDRPAAPVFLNLYVILVAESGVTRKSSAVRVANHIQQQFARLLPSDESAQVIEGKCSTEKLDELMADQSTMHGHASVAIAISELAVFLGTERYTQTMPGLLTDVYDCPATRRAGGTISRGEVVQSNLYVNFLAASTPAWLLKSVNPTVVQGGFTSRCMFVVSEKPKAKIAWPVDDGTSATRVAALLSDLWRIRGHANTYRTIKLNDGAMQTFTAWYRRRTISVDDYRASFESREDAHVLRMAAYLCINDGTWVVQHHHVLLAIRIIDKTKDDGSRLFTGTQERNRYILGVEAVRAALMQAGLEPMPRSKLFLRARYYIDFAEFTAMLDVMHEMGAIQRFEMKLNNHGRAVELVRATKLLTVKNSAYDILERIT